MSDLRPFPRGFNPSHRRVPPVVPQSFSSQSSYLDTMAQSTRAELAALVQKQQRRPRRLAARVISQEGDKVWLEVPAPPVDDGSRSKTLLRAPSGHFYIVRRCVTDEESPQAQIEISVGDAHIETNTTFNDFGYIGDLMASYYAIQSLREQLEDGSPPRLLRSVADPNQRICGRLTSLTEAQPPGGCNAEQLSALRGLLFGLEAVQGPPGCGKTKLIADILNYLVPSDTTALMTSTSRQAIDNLCEKLEASGHTLPFVVLGGTQRLAGYPFLKKYHLDAQVERDPEVVRLKKVLAKFQRIISHGFEECIRRINTQRAQQRRQLESLLPVADVLVAIIPDVVPNPLGPLLWKAAMRESLSSVIGTFLAALSDARAEAEECIIDSCRVFVSTIGSVHHVQPYAVSKNLQTIVVDEASRLLEIDVPRLLTLTTDLDNLILVGDQNQLEPFSHAAGGRGGGGATSSLMQRFADSAPRPFGCHMLKEQYRMHPSLCDTVSKFSYDGQLRTNSTVAAARTASEIPGETPLQFHDINLGSETKVRTTFKNVQEADKVVALYLQERCHSRSSYVMVIAMYRAQVELLEKKLADIDK